MAHNVSLKIVRFKAGIILLLVCDLLLFQVLKNLNAGHQWRFAGVPILARDCILPSMIILMCCSNLAHDPPTSFSFSQSDAREGSYSVWYIFHNSHCLNSPPTTPTKFEMYITFVDISLSFLLGSKNKNAFGEIYIFRLQSPLIKLWEVNFNSVSYGKYTTLNMVLLLHLLG